jgi:hypothetical protein
VKGKDRGRSAEFFNKLLGAQQAGFLLPSDKGSIQNADGECDWAPDSPNGTNLRIGTDQNTTSIGHTRTNLCP